MFVGPSGGTSSTLSNEKCASTPSTCGYSGWSRFLGVSAIARTRYWLSSKETSRSAASPLLIVSPSLMSSSVLSKSANSRVSTTTEYFIKGGIGTVASPPVRTLCCVIWISPVVISSKSASVTISDSIVPVIRSHVSSPGRCTSNRTASVGGDDRDGEVCL